MMNALVVACVVGAAVQPQGSPETVKWKKPAHVVPAGGEVSFAVKGPTSLLLDVFSESKSGSVSIEVERDGSHVSKNEVKVRAKRGPKGYGGAAQLGIAVPEGEHTYVVKSSTKVAVSANTVRKFSRRIAAAAETAVASAAPPPEPAPEPEPEPAATTAAMADGGGSVEEVRATDADMPPEMPSSDSAVNAMAGLVQARRIAVYDFELAGIEPNIGAVVTDSILAELRKLQGVSAIGMDEIKDMLSHEANKQMLGCEASESCLAEIAGALGVDELVTGKLSKAADEHVLLVRRIDQKRAKVAGVYDKRLKAGSGQEFLLSVGPAVEDLYPDRALRDGASRGVPESVALRLDPPPLPKWSFYTVAGGAVAAAALGGIFGLLANQKEDEFQSLARQGQQGPVNGAELKSIGDDADRNATIANASFISAGVLAVAAGVMFLFTDWEGYAEENAGATYGQ